MLIATFLVLTLAWAITLWGFGLFVQKYWYEHATEYFPVRALVGALIISVFMTFWTYVNTRAEWPNKYGTLLEMSSTGERDLREFQAVRHYPKRSDKSETVKHTLSDTPGAGYIDPNGKEFKLYTSDYLTTAIVVSDGNREVRYDADMSQPTVYAEPKIFRDKSGRSYIEATSIGRVYSPNRVALFVGLLLNLVIVLVWFIVFWPVMRLNFWHSVFLSLIFGVTTIMALMPLLFQKHTKTNQPPAITSKV